MERNIYKIGKELFITNDEEINKDTKTCWCIDISCNELVLHQGVLPSYHYKHYKKIIMTTDKSINVLCSCGKDCGAKESGIQAIDDEFLEWFVKNPNCEEIEVVDVRSLGVYGSYYPYKINIPKKETKQETLEEIAIQKRNELGLKGTIDGFIAGAKWQQERMYSEEEVKNLIKIIEWYDKESDVRPNYTPDIEERIGEISMWDWFEQFKKK